MPPERERAAVSTLILLRHGETAWNRERRLMGAADVPLSEAGRQQCERVGEVLAGFGIDRIRTSPLSRALESARIVAQAIAAPVESDEGLVEVRFGEWQGKTYEEIAADPRYEGYVEDPVGQPTPGGETVADVQRRGLISLSAARPGERVLFVTHGDLIRSVLCRFLAIPLAEFRRLRIDNCGLSAVALANGRGEVKFVNMLADPARAWDPVHWTRHA
ncbi:MAG: histidine phosphatase family protein [Deltaproteobacteria bacterium]|nr:histidine phosphatase family protein [Deltaproteobacteria bacterium]